MSKKLLQILDISTISVDTDLFNVTAINYGKDPYWVEFIQPFFDDIEIEIKILSLDKIDLTKKWFINVDINMWNWDLHTGSLFEKFNPIIQHELKNGKAYIILNHQCESFTKSFFNILYSKNIEIPFSKIIYMVAAADIEREYTDYIKENNIKKEKQLTVLYAHHVYKRFKHDVDINSFHYEPAKKIKKYLSLNRRWRDHRVMLS